MLVLHMANTRNCVTDNNAENNGENNNDDANPLPRPPPTLEPVLAMQAQMLHTVQQTMVNLHAQPQALPPSLRDRLGDFQCTKLLTFSHAVEPMDADDWLKSIKKKMQVVQYNNHQRVLVASHKLSGPEADCCDAYMEAHEEPESINWPEFRAAFCAHHVPQGVIKMKKEF
jgi:hypothetical protein